MRALERIPRDRAIDGIHAFQEMRYATTPSIEILTQLGLLTLFFFLQRWFNQVFEAVRTGRKSGQWSWCPRVFRVTSKKVKMIPYTHTRARTWWNSKEEGKKNTNLATNFFILLYRICFFGFWRNPALRPEIWYITLHLADTYSHWLANITHQALYAIDTLYVELEPTVNHPALG